MYFIVARSSTRTGAVHRIFRYIYTSKAECNISKQGRLINKFIKRNQSKRDPSNYIINGSSYEAPKKQLSVYTQRRMNVLNKVFMEHITDMMSTGEIGLEILKRDIEISHIKVTPDFKLINVFWIDNCIESTDTEELLHNCAFQLRHHLSQLRVIGNVPPIQFVRCRGIGKLKEIEQKLKQLDFGEDHEPSVYPDTIHHTVTVPISPISDKEVQDVEQENTVEDTFSVFVPVMKHDVFGLNHHHIMSKIKVSLSKAKKVKDNPITNTISDTNPPSMVNILNSSEQQQQFTKFLSQWQKERRYRKKKNCSRVDELVDDFEEMGMNDDNDYELECDYNDAHNDDYANIDEYIDENEEKIM